MRVKPKEIMGKRTGEEGGMIILKYFCLFFLLFVLKREVLNVKLKLPKNKSIIGVRSHRVRDAYIYDSFFLNVIVTNHFIRLYSICN